MVPNNGVTPAAVVAEFLKGLPSASPLLARLSAAIPGVDVMILAAQATDAHVFCLQGRQTAVDVAVGEMERRLIALGSSMARCARLHCKHSLQHACSVTNGLRLSRFLHPSRHLLARTIRDRHHNTRVQCHY